MIYLICTCLGWLLGAASAAAWSLDGFDPRPDRTLCVRDRLPTCTAIPTAWRRARW